MKILPFLFIGSLFASPLFAQHRPGGIRLDDEGYRRTPLRTGTRNSTLGDKRSIAGPGVFALNQGDNGVCTGFSTATLVGIRQMNYCNGRYLTNSPMIEFSGMYLCCKTDHTLPDSGYSMQQIFDILLKYGMPLALDYPNDPHGCPFAITPHVDSLAAAFRLWNYARIFNLATEVCPDSNEVCLDRHRQQIYDNTVSAIDVGLPAILVLALPPGFDSLHSDNCTLITQRPPTTVIAARQEYHAVVVTGYDDQKQVFQILNSFGKTWGCDGFAYIGYDIFKKSARYGYVLEWELGFDQEVPCEAPFKK